MKYFGKDKKGVYLEPANGNYKRIRPKRSLTIGGIVKAVVVNMTLTLHQDLLYHLTNKPFG